MSTSACWGVSSIGSALRAAPKAGHSPQLPDPARKMSGSRQPAPVLAWRALSTACPQKAPPALWVRKRFSTEEDEKKRERTALAWAGQQLIDALYRPPLLASGGFSTVFPQGCARHLWAIHRQRLPISPDVQWRPGATRVQFIHRDEQVAHRLIHISWGYPLSSRLFSGQ